MHNVNVEVHCSVQNYVCSCAICFAAIFFCINGIRSFLINTATFGPSYHLLQIINR